jgi:hypothetical protein
MNYSVVHDEEAFQSFIDWLPELQVNEKYYLSLFARRKYSEVVKTDKANLKRFATDKARMLEKVRQLECAQGSYIAKDVAVPAEALALYICVNPRCSVKASYQTIIALTESLQRNHQNLNPHSEAMTQLHKSPARKTFVVFDVDRKDDLSETMSSTREIVGDAAPTFLETRGGVHVLINVSLVKSEHKNWYPELEKRIDPDQTGDLLIPVPGCCQGGFVPRFVN